MSSKKTSTLIIQGGKYEKIVCFFLSLNFDPWLWFFLIPQMIFGVIIFLMVEWWTGFGKTFRFR